MHMGCWRRHRVEDVLYSCIADNKGQAFKIRDAAGDVPVYEVGDCTQPAKVYEAVRAGFEAAVTIL